MSYHDNLVLAVMRPNMIANCKRPMLVEEVDQSQYKENKRQKPEADPIMEEHHARFRVTECETDVEPFHEVNKVTYVTGLEMRNSVMNEALQKCYDELKKGPRVIPVPDEKRHLVCPIYAKDPTACDADFTMTEIGELLKHIDERHPHPDLYCPTCWLDFDDEVYDRDSHIRRRDCQARPKPLKWGVPAAYSENFEIEVFNHTERNEEYDIIFKYLQPGKTRAPAIFWDNYTSFVIDTVMSHVTEATLTADTAEEHRLARRCGPFGGELPWWQNKMIRKLLEHRAKEHCELFKRRQESAAFMDIKSSE